MQILENNDYRQILKFMVKEFARSGKSLTWKKIAARVPVQYTYLSRALNREDTHLSEDHLHEICKILNLMPDETEYLLTLRGLAVATSQSRRDFLTKKLLSIRHSKRTTTPMENAGSVGGDVRFLLSPQAWITFFALGVKQHRENPRKLAALLGIEPDQLRGILNTLHDLGLIQVGDDIFDIVKINKNHFHYGPDHPLTRLHQQMLRMTCDSHYWRLPESKRQRFMVTFNADEEAMKKIDDLFSAFIKEVEKTVIKAPSKGTYQLNFELFPWL